MREKYSITFTEEKNYVKTEAAVIFFLRHLNKQIFQMIFQLIM